jgi:Fur family peroxide stress response transcriptional regulator
MQGQAAKERIRQFAELCRERGLPVTVQRRAVLEELLLSEEHPSADQIFQGVRRRIPGISHTTVYRVLELLVNLGLARRTGNPGSTTRYDPNLQRHHHLICSSCERISDLEDPSLDSMTLPEPERTGFEIVDYSIHFQGLCPECRRKRDAGKS